MRQISTTDLYTQGHLGGEGQRGGFIADAMKMYDQLGKNLVDFTGQQNQVVAKATARASDAIVEASDVGIKGFEPPKANAMQVFNDEPKSDGPVFNAAEAFKTTNVEPLAPVRKGSADYSSVFAPADTTGVTTAAPVASTGDSNMDRLKAAIMGGTTLGLA